MRRRASIGLALVAACGSRGAGAGVGGGVHGLDATSADAAVDAAPAPDAGLGAWTAIAPPTAPARPQIIFTAVHGGTLYTYAGTSKIYRTTDEGATWDDLPYGSVAISHDGLTLYATGTTGPSGVSRDGGATWAEFSSALEVGAVAADPALVYGVIPRWDPTGEVWHPDSYVSENAGVDNTPLSLGDRAAAFYADPFATDRAYAYEFQGIDALSYWRSDDRGASWKEISFGGPMRVDSIGAGTLWRYLGTSVDHSVDAGDTWTPVVGAPGTVRELVAAGDGTAIAFTADLGVWRVTPAGAWSRVGTTPVPVSTTPSDVAHAFIGGTPTTLVIVPQVVIPDRIYISHTLGG